MIRQDYAKPLPREINREHEESIIARAGLYMLAVLVACLFYFGG